MSVDHVLAAIDGALEDWEVSGDAMRWAPEPPAPIARQPRPIVLHTAIDPGAFNEALAEVTRRLADWAQSAGQVMVGVEQFMENFNREEFHRRWKVLPVDTSDADRRSRALELRRTRNTGPERPSAGRQKRPRSL